MVFKKFPSYDYIIRGAVRTLRRFPFAMLCALVGTIAAVALIQMEDADRHFTLQKIVFVCALGIPLLIALTALAERRGRRGASWLGLQALGLLLLVAYYFSLPARFFEYSAQPVRFIVLFVACHLMMAFLLYLGKGQANGFWQYNKSLFLRILTSALFSAVMFIGLAIALAAIDQLFGLDVPDKRYFQLFAIMLGTFNTWVFLAGVPGDIGSLNEIVEYPRGLKIFAQYILLPLVGIYLVILYAYELKIIIEWNWPKGWVSQLVLWFSVVGILSLLLLWPLRDKAENRWIRTFTKWFFRALIPLVAMLFLAILERVGVYGITANRYLVLAMAVGLAILVLYFVFGRGKDIRAIPVVICIIALLSAYGPWNAFAVSRRSQQARLENYLAKYNLNPGAAVEPASGPISLDDRSEMSSIVSYLLGWHGPNAFSPWLPDSAMASLRDTASYRIAEDRIAGQLGFEYVARWQHEGGRRGHFYFMPVDSAAVALTGYEYLLYYKYNEWGKEPARYTFSLNGDTCHVWFMGMPPVLSVQLGDDSTGAVRLSLAARIDSLLDESADQQVPRERLIFNIDGRSFDSRIILGDLSGEDFGDSLRVTHINAQLLIRRNH